MFNRITSTFLKVAALAKNLKVSSIIAPSVDDRNYMINMIFLLQRLPTVGALPFLCLKNYGNIF